MISPLENGLVDEVKDLRRRLQNIENTSQVQFAEWLPAPVEFSYDSANTIEATITAGSSFLLTDFLSVGDKFRYKQGGAFKYAYVVAVDASKAVITGGSDFVLANAAITDASKGIAEFPLDFPLRFKWDPNITPSAGVYTNLDPAVFETFEFSVKGDVVTMFLSISNGSLTALATVDFEPPVPAEITPAVPAINTFVGDNFVPTQGLTKFGGPELVQIFTWKVEPTGKYFLVLEGFLATTNGFAAGFIMDYVIASDIL